MKKIEEDVTLSLPSLQMLSDGDYWLEIKAIIGGVLGFWGGVGGLGSLILVIVLSQVREGAEPEVATYRYVKKVKG